MIIHGGKPLQGDVWIGGAKNSTVALIPASILSRTPVTLEGVPRIADVVNLMDLLSEMDVHCDFGETTLRIDPENIKMSPLPAGKIKSLRASYYFMGALLGRFGKAVVGFPGGDDIGPRPIDQHIKGFEALGASVKNENDQIIITAPEDGLHGAKIHLKMPSVGATMNIIMASVTAQGQTIIENAAKEPEIIDLATFLNNMGAVIRGAGTDSIRIEGVDMLKAQIPHTIIPDRIEAGTYVSLAACIGNGIRIHNIIEEHLDSYLAKVEEMGVVIDADEEEIKQGLGYTVLTRTLQFLKAFLKYYDPTITEDVLTMFSEIVQDTYKRFGIDFNTDFSRFTSNDYPTFTDVYATIKGRLMSMTEQTQERDIMERLELKIRPLTKELRFYFDGHTTLSRDSDFMVFNIKELMNTDSNIRNALFFNVLKYAWGLCLDFNVDTVLMVDEAHVLLGANNVLGAEFLAQVQRRARKYNTGTIIITQQPSDFADPGVIMHGKAIFDNASYYLVMGLRKQAVEDLSLLIDLNDSEKESIKRYSQGEALFVCGNRRMRINIAVTKEELDSFGSSGGF